MKIKGPFIKQVMRDRGITQRELAKQLGISYSALSQALTQCAMNETTLIKLSEILKIPAADLSMLEQSPDKQVSDSIMQAGETLGRLTAQIEMLNKDNSDFNKRLTVLEIEFKTFKEKLKSLGQ